MKLIKTFLFVSVLFLFACNDKGKKQDTKVETTYENSKMTISEIESKNPKKFLKVEGRDKHNLIGQTVVKGKISNTATVVAYKDVTIKISFFSKTGTLLEEDEETIYNEVKPGETLEFKSKFYPPKGSSDVKLNVINAKVSK
jgi:hypothetical protein